MGFGRFGWDLDGFGFICVVLGFGGFAFSGGLGIGCCTWGLVGGFGRDLSGSGWDLVVLVLPGLVGIWVKHWAK